MREPDRFSIYRVVGARGDHQEIATVDSPEALGVAIVTLADEGEFERATLGVFDHGDGDEVAGRWLVNPWPSRIW